MVSPSTQPVPSPKSLAWAGRYASGRTHSTTTSIPTEPATAPRKPSTDIIELGRRTARGYRNPASYQLRMLLIAGGLDASISTHTQLEEPSNCWRPAPAPPCPSAASRLSSSNTPEHGMYNESSVLIREPHSPVGSLGDASHPSLPRAESSVIGSTVVYLETSNEDGVHTIFRWSVLGRCH